MEAAEEAVRELYDFRDRYFERHDISRASEKAKCVDERMTATLQKLDELPDEDLDVKTKARLMFLRGHANNVVPDFNEKGEQFLSRAVKLDPTLTEAWNSLGECYWKQGNVKGAFDCFNGALRQVQNKVSLRNVSMILRQTGEGAAERFKNFKLSVEKAKEAVSMDVSDGISWYVLGNAYLSLFFISGNSDSLLKQCMTAYAQAEKDLLAANNPDLHYNRAVAYQYEEKFQLALDGFMKAVAFDPNWTEPQEHVDRLEAYLVKVSGMATNKGRLKPKKLVLLQQGISEKDLGPYNGGQYVRPTGQTVDLREVPLSELREGINGEVIVVGKVVGVITSTGNITSQTLAVVDKVGSCVIVTIFHMSSSTAPLIGDSLAIPEPQYQITNVHCPKQGHLSFPSIRVDNPLCLVVNKHRVSKEKLVPSVLDIVNKSE